ncbi:MAG: radical SAM protein [bacterium]
MGSKRSCFTVLASAQDSEDRVHIYHTLRDHHIVVDQSPQQTIDSFLEKVERGCELSGDEVPAAETFREMGILVDADADEHKDFERWYDTVLRGDNDSMVVHITTTMACNMRCCYCLEKDLLDQSKFMDHGTALGSAAWIKREVASRGVRKLSLVFFGGEPLMNARAIEEIGADLNEYCAGYGIAFKAGAITNGTLLTPEITNALAKAGVTWVKVTLDGDKSLHDKMRVLAKGGGTFDLIWQNLESAADRLRLFIGGNFPEGDLGAFDSLLERLAGVPWRESIAEVTFKPIMKPKKGNAIAMNTDCGHGAFTQGQVHRMLEMRRRIRAAGLPSISDPNLGPCDFYRNNVLTIGAGGEIYPCSGFVGISDFVIGSIRSSEPTAFGDRLRTLRAWCDECKGCTYLPVCAGGCRLPAYLEGKDVSATVCDREFYERMIPMMLSARHEGGAAESDQSGIFA